MPRSERRAQLLEAAQAVFVAQGYHAAAMDEIADRAGVSKPVLYQHFPGKLDLYLALLDTHCESLEKLVRAALAQPDATSGRAKVEATVGAYFDFVTREDAAFRMIPPCCSVLRSPGWPRSRPGTGWPSRRSSARRRRRT